MDFLKSVLYIQDNHESHFSSTEKYDCITNDIRKVYNEVHIQLENEFLEYQVVFFGDRLIAWTLALQKDGLLHLCLQPFLQPSTHDVMALSIGTITGQQTNDMLDFFHPTFQIIAPTHEPLKQLILRQEDTLLSAFAIATEYLNQATSCDLVVVKLYYNHVKKLTFWFRNGAFEESSEMIAHTIEQETATSYNPVRYLIHCANSIGLEELSSSTVIQPISTTTLQGTNKLEKKLAQKSTLCLKLKQKVQSQNRDLVKLTSENQQLRAYQTELQQEMLKQNQAICHLKEKQSVIQEQKKKLVLFEMNMTKARQQEETLKFQLLALQREHDIQQTKLHDTLHQVQNQQKHITYYQKEIQQLTRQLAHHTTIMELQQQVASYKQRWLHAQTQARVYQKKFQVAQQVCRTLQLSNS